MPWAYPHAFSAPDGASKTAYLRPFLAFCYLSTILNFLKFCQIFNLRKRKNVTRFSRLKYRSTRSKSQVHKYTNALII